MRYVTIGTLGCGGMGRVDLALTCNTPGVERLVVLKTVRLDVTGDERDDRMRDLTWEANIAASIVHPNVIATIDLDRREGDELVLVLEYLEGVTLRQLVTAAGRHGGVLPRPVLLRIVRDALLGLSHVHQLRGGADNEPLGIVHRDISPANILITVNGITKVLDFGIAKARTSTTDTPAGFVKGKLRYMAPEQVLGTGLDCRTDIFAIGVILWEGLTGLAFGGAKPEQSFAARLTDSCPRVSSVQPIDAMLDEIVARCLRKSSEDRFTSAAQLAQILETYARSHEGLALDEDIGRLIERTFATHLAERRASISAAYSRLIASVPNASTATTTPTTTNEAPPHQPTDARASFAAALRTHAPLLVVSALSAALGAILTRFL